MQKLCSVCETCCPDKGDHEDLAPLNLIIMIIYRTVHGHIINYIYVAFILATRVFVQSFKTKIPMSYKRLGFVLELQRCIFYRAKFITVILTRFKLD
jgi:hypothetical protein